MARARGHLHGGLHAELVQDAQGLLAFTCQLHHCNRIIQGTGIVCVAFIFRERRATLLAVSPTDSGDLRENKNGWCACPSDNG